MQGVVSLIWAHWTLLKDGRNWTGGGDHSRKNVQSVISLIWVQTVMKDGRNWTGGMDGGRRRAGSVK